MNYSDIIDEVVAWTKRPDLSAKTASAVRTATMFAHRSDNYWRDLNSDILVPISAAEGIILLDSYLPRFREIASIEPEDNGTLFPGLVPRDVDDLFDEYSTRRKNWFLGTRQGIRYNTAILTPNLQISYYMDPDTNPTTYDSWIADIYPDVIIKWATGLMFRTIGNSDESKAEIEGAQALLQTMVSHDFAIKGR